MDQEIADMTTNSLKHQISCVIYVFVFGFAFINVIFSFCNILQAHSYVFSFLISQIKKKQSYDLVNL